NSFPAASLSPHGTSTRNLYGPCIPARAVQQWDCDPRNASRFADPAGGLRPIPVGRRSHCARRHSPAPSEQESAMMHPYNSQCDDLGVYVYLNTKMDLPAGRESVLHFFEALQKNFPAMTD